MKKQAVIFLLSFIVILASCEDNTKPGRVYMPDMYYSRAYETYADHGNLSAKGAFYNNRPVAGTISRGEELPYHLTNDSTGYAQSGTVTDPLPKLNSTELVEAERLYLINCAICHGPGLNGNGPLYKDGNGPFAAKPANLVGDPKIIALKEGTIFHVMTYGKNLMGSYASQLNRKQRWMVAQYVKSKQPQGQAGGAAGGASDSATTKTATAPQNAAK